MDNQTITYRTREAFKKEFGRPVESLRDIKQLEPSDISFIPNYYFKNHVQAILTSICEIDALIDSFIIHAQQNILFPDKRDHDNDNTNKIHQKLYTDLHDALMHQMDHKIINFAHLIKVSEFLPLIAPYFRGVFCHLVEQENVPRRIYNFPFEILRDKDYLLGNINETIEEVFPTLLGLRYLFSEETKKSRKSMMNKDDFAQKFLRCEEVQERDMSDRIEYQFLRDFGITLDISPIKNQKLRHYIGKKISDERHILHMFNETISGKFAHRIPGIATRPDTTFSAFSRDFKHFKCAYIPRTGLIFG